jgi:ADP-ribose pyrophosphatase YjhB (NUDIX family)
MSLDFERPLVTVDVVTFAIFSDALHILLVKRGKEKSEPYPNRWALVGGFVDVHLDASLEATALRKLREKTGVSTPYLEQLGSWGNNKRDPRGWSATHVYFALIPPEFAISPVHGANTTDAIWMPVTDNGVNVSLAFDHAHILGVALERLRNKIEYTSLPAFLLPKIFTLSELQRVYEIALGRKLEKSAFRTRVLATDLVVPRDQYREGPNRPAQLYTLNSPDTPVFFQRTFKPISESLLKGASL